MPVRYFPLIAGNVSWGDIKGDIASQTDLLAGLDSKLSGETGAFNALAEKTSAADEDILLIEDSANGYEKKKLKASKLKGTLPDAADLQTVRYNEAQEEWLANPAMRSDGEKTTVAAGAGYSGVNPNYVFFATNYGNTSLQTAEFVSLGSLPALSVSNSDPAEYVFVIKNGKVKIEALQTPESHPANFKSVYVDTDSGKIYSQETPADGDLLSANNLSDLNDVALARDNLGLGNSATKSTGTGHGDVAAGDHGHSVRLTHNWLIPGEIKVASGNEDFLCPMYFAQDAVIKGYYAKINAGTSATIKIQLNESDEISSIVVDTNGVSSTAQTINAAAGDLASIVVESVVGSPLNLTFALIVDYGV